ncbi:hypothetical protein V6N13_095642 [Hibiscus sabdariffa]|uniref:Uncharacterized protein n=1 Tax=Hibiscus sabdariffa TaxID=183260 RepID=A0ABR2B746_9ROSI
MHVTRPKESVLTHISYRHAYQQNSLSSFYYQNNAHIVRPHQRKREAHLKYESPSVLSHQRMHLAVTSTEHPLLLPEIQYQKEKIVSYLELDELIYEL